jgi:hypothetical protein
MFKKQRPFRLSGYKCKEKHAIAPKEFSNN